jgi:hypothetical protein
VTCTKQLFRIEKLVEQERVLCEWNMRKLLRKMGFMRVKREKTFLYSCNINSGFSVEQELDYAVERR